MTVENKNHQQIKQQQTKDYEKNQAPQLESINKSNIEQTHISTFSVYLRGTIISMGSLFYGYQLSVLNLSQKKLDYVYGLEENLELYHGLLASCLLFGSVFGCFLAGIFMKKFGERKTSIFCDILVIFLCLFYIIPNFYVSLMIRTLLGVLVGINASVVPLFLSKISPTQLLPKTGSFHGIYLTNGIFLAICLGQGFPIAEQDIQQPEEIYWRVVLMLPILFSLLRLICLTTVYNQDTPYFYLQTLQPLKAKAFLSQIYKPQYVEQEFERIQQDYLKSTQQKEETYKSLFSKSQRTRSLIGICNQILLQFTGIIAIIFYSSTILESVTGSAESANFISLLIMTIFTIMPLFSGTLVQKLGRRPILLYGNAVIILSLLGIGTTSLLSEFQEEYKDICGYLSILFILVNLCSFNLSIGTVVWIYNAEILGAKGNCLSVSLQLFTAFVIGLAFPIGVEIVGIYSIFYIFATVLLLGMPFLYRNLKETKGVVASDIPKLFFKEQVVFVKQENRKKMENTKSTQKNLSLGKIPSTQTVLTLENE